MDHDPRGNRSNTPSSSYTGPVRSTSQRIPARRISDDMTEAEQIAKFGYTRSSSRVGNTGQTQSRTYESTSQMVNVPNAQIPPQTYDHMPNSAPYPRTPAAPGYMPADYDNTVNNYTNPNASRNPMDGYPVQPNQGNMPEPSGESFTPVNDATSQYTLPLQINPFDEQEGEAPQLAKTRSKAVKQKKGSFWSDPENPGKMSSAVSKPDNSSFVKATVITVLVLAVAAVILLSTVFRVREVIVQGNSNISSNEIIQLSGVKKGSSIFSLDKEKAKAGINGNPYLLFRDISYELPNRVTIIVRERSSELAMSYCGIWYILDSRGMVLEKLGDIQATEGLIQISGLDINAQYGVSVGKTLITSNSKQVSVLQEVMLELKVLDAKSEVVKIVLSDLDNILLETREGYSVRLGNSENIHAKLKSMLCTKEEIARRETRSGTIDVSNPQKPTFIPEEGL